MGNNNDPNALIVDGYNITSLLTEYTSKHEITEGKNPLIERQRSLQDSVGKLEDLVKQQLGEGIQADRAKAGKIIDSVLEQYAKDAIPGYKANEEEKGEAKDQRLRGYLSEIGQLVGDRTITSKEELIKAIMNMDSAKPGDVAYDQNSSLGRLINYIAQKSNKDNERLQYIEQVIGERFTKEGVRGETGSKFGLNLTADATAGEAFNEYRRRVSLQAQLQSAQNTNKTYLQPPANDDHYQQAA